MAVITGGEVISPVDAQRLNTLAAKTINISRNEVLVTHESRKCKLGTLEVYEYLSNLDDACNISRKYPYLSGNVNDIQ